MDVKNLEYEVQNEIIHKRNLELHVKKGRKFVGSAAPAAGHQWYIPVHCPICSSARVAKEFGFSGDGLQFITQCERCSCVFSIERN